MRETNATFDTYHALDVKHPVYLVKFDGEAVDYSTGAVGTPINTIKQYIVDIKGGGQRIIPEQGRSSIGGITFGLQDQGDEITALLATDTYYFHRKKVTIKIGYQGMDEADFLTILVGWITDIKEAK